MEKFIKVHIIIPVFMIQEIYEDIIVSYMNNINVAIFRHSLDGGRLTLTMLKHH